LPGYLWDLASVPRGARWLIDNDDIDIQEGAIVHDANYSGHYLGDDLPGLDLTNWLIREMMRYRGSRVRGAIVHAAVNSIIGRSLYWKKAARDDVTSKFVVFASGTF